MASLDFPSNPTNNQTYALNGVTYYYNSSMGAWLTQLTSMNLSTSSNTQVLFNDAGLANGSSGLVFDKTTNTLSVNQIGGLAGNTINTSFNTANAAYASQNANYATTNAAYSTTNAAFAKANASYQFSWSTTVQTSNFAASSNTGYAINTTSGAVTATLPASPSSGDRITFVDYAGTVATNNITINPNGNKINGFATNGIMTTNRMAYNLVYIDSTQGWIGYSQETAAVQQTYTIEYLLVGGGGGGGGSDCGGGGGEIGRAHV